MRDKLRPWAVALLLPLLILVPLRGETDKLLEEAWKQLGSAGPHFSRGLKEYDRGRKEAAAAAFLECLREMPRHSYAHYYLANLLYIQGDHRGSLGHMEQALAHFDLMQDLGDYADERRGRDIGDLRRMLDKEWENSDSCRTARRIEALGDQVSMEQNRMELLAGKRPALRARQKAQYLYFSGNVLFQLKRFPEALTRYQEAIGCDPLHASAYGNAAAILYQAGDSSAALALLEKAESQGLEDELNLKLKCLVFEALGKPTEGILQEELSDGGEAGQAVMRFALACRREDSRLPPLYENCYVVSDKRSRKAVVIDPGERDPRIDDYVRTRGLEVEAVLNTHDHPDHSGADRYYSDLFGAQVCAPEKDGKSLSPPPDRYLGDGQTLNYGGLAVRTILTPGHTPGSLCFLIGDFLFTGDTLFRNGIGRVWAEDSARTAKVRDELVRGIEGKLLALPGGTKVCPGHGKTSTIAAEKALNPFLKNPGR